MTITQTKLLVVLDTKNEEAATKELKALLMDWMLNSENVSFVRLVDKDVFEREFPSKPL